MTILVSGVKSGDFGARLPGKERKVFKTALKYALMALLIGGPLRVAYSESASGGITLIGRGDKVKVIDKSGSAQDVDTKSLRVNSGVDTSVKPAAKAVVESDAKKADGAKEGDKKAEPGKAEADKKAAAAPEEDPIKKKAREKEEAERKAAEKEKLQRLVNQGAWFYDKSGKALSGEEIQKRIESGKTGDIKTLDLYQQEWSTSASKDEESDGDSKDASAPTSTGATASTGQVKPAGGK